MGGTTYLYGGTGAHEHLDPIPYQAHLFYTPFPIEATSVFYDVGHIAPTSEIGGASRAYSLTTRVTTTETRIIYGTSPNGWLSSHVPLIFGDHTPIQQVPWANPDNTVIADLVTLNSSPGDTVYGGSGDRASCIAGRAHFFKWHPSTGIVDIPLPMEFRNTECIVRSLVEKGGLIYGGTQPNAWFFVYNPGTGAFPVKIQVPGEQTVSALATPLTTIEGLEKIWGGTSPNGKLFLYDIPTNNLTVLGTAIPDPFQNAIGDLELIIVDDIVPPPPDTAIYVYGGTAPDGFFFRYEIHNPWCPGVGPASNPENLGQAVCDENRVRSLQGVLGKRSDTGETIKVLVGGTGSADRPLPPPRGHVFSHNPQTGGPLSPKKPGENLLILSIGDQLYLKDYRSSDSTLPHNLKRTDPLEQIESFLLEASPNHLHGEIEISFALPTSGFVSLRIYDTTGRFVKNLMDEERGKGEHSLIWDGKNEKGDSVTSGIYFFNLRTANDVATKKILILR